MGRTGASVNNEWLKCPVIIPYLGGKFELSRKLVPMLPPHERYIEMFAGGLSMFFRKPSVDWNVVNDFDNDIVNLYISVVERFDELASYIYWYPRSRTLFDEIREEIHASKKIDIPDPRRAARYFFLIRTAFNKSVHGSFSKHSKKGWGDALIKELKHSRQFFNKVTIENMDFRVLSERYEPRAKDCWYLDPPYVVSERGDYYFHGFGKQEHKDLKDIADIIDKNGGKFMISYDSNDWVKETYKDYNVQVINTKYAGASEAREKIFEELVIMIYQPAPQESLFT